MKLIQQSKLYFKENNSDKVYEIDLCELSATEYVVNFRYGRRGASLKAGTKTPQAVSREKANAVFAELENEKRKKGYQIQVEVDTPPIDLPPLENLNPDSVNGVILQRLQNAITGKNTFKTEWRTSRVIWRAGELQIQEAIPFIITLATQGNELQTYSALWALIRMQAKEAESLFRAFAFQPKQKAHLRYMACEGLFTILQEKELEGFTWEFLEKLPSNIKSYIENKDYPQLSIELEQDTEKKQIEYVSNLYLLSKVYPDLTPVLHGVLKSWKFEPPFFKHIRAMYKLAQVRNDYPTLAVISYRFEKDGPMFKRTQPLNSRYNQYVSSLNEHLRVGSELKSPDSKVAYSHYTKKYFQKNSIEYLKKTGKEQQAKEYLQLAVSTLLQYNRADYEQGGEKPLWEYGQYDYKKKLYYYTLINYPECYNSLLLTTILFGNDPKRELKKNLKYIYGERMVSSQRYYYDPNQVTDIQSNDTQDTTTKSNNKSESSIIGVLKGFFGGKKEETVPPVETAQEAPTEEQTKPEASHRLELHPEYWDAMPAAYVQLLMQANMDIIHRFAYDNLTAHAAYQDICTRFDAKAILLLLNREFDIPNKLGYEALIKRENELRQDPDFVAQVLNCNSSEARTWAQTTISNNTEFYFNELNFIVLLIFNARKENDNWINKFLQQTRFSEERQQALLGKVVTELLRFENTDENNELARMVIKRISLFADSQLSKISWDIIEQLIVSPLLSNIWLSSNILMQKSKRIDATEIPVSVIDLFLRSDITEVRQNGIKLLNQYPDYFLERNYNFVLNQVENPNEDVLKEILPCIRKLLRNSSKGEITAQHFNYCLIRKEKFEGAHALINEFMLHDLQPYWNKGLSPKDITKLIHAQYRLSQLTGYKILQAYENTKDFTLGQIISFGNHEVLAIRHWCWHYFRDNVSRIRYEKDKALNLLDSKWDDTRAFAFQFFKTEFTDADWDSDTLIGIIDSIRPDVEAFGSELITRYFKPEKALEYLTKLSEHPSVNVQGFITNYLSIYATGNVEAIATLEYYFRSVLTRVNKARVAKDRILNFLRQEALNDVKVAEIITPILDDMSAQSTVQDKAVCINILAEIKSNYPHLDMHLTIKN